MRLNARPTFRLPVVAGVIAGLLVVPVIAGVDTAGATTPSVPVGMRVSAVTATSFTVRLPAVHGATYYRLLASTTRSDVYAENYRRTGSHRVSASAVHPSITVTKLRYTTAPYFYRVLAVHGTSIRWSDTIGSVGLRPARPTTPTAHAAGYLTWSAGSATGSRIEQADNAAFTTGTRTWSVRGSTHVFTPYGLIPGHTYWFRVRSTNTTTPSPASSTVRLTPSRATAPLRVMTYNVLASAFDGTDEGGQKVAPWSARVVGVATLIARAAPAVVAVQEGYGPVAATQRPAAQPCTNDADSYHYFNRHDVVHQYVQIDSLCDALGGRYRRVDDSTDSTQGADFGTLHAGLGNYLLYDPKKLAPVAGESGFWNLGPGALHTTNERNAGFAVFTVLATGTTVLITSAHPTAMGGATYDRIRGTQTASLVSQARATAAADHVTSIVYAGDYNAYPDRVGATDTPGARMRAIGAVDSLQTAQSVHDSSYNSVNLYQRTPPQHGGSVDHVYVTPGIGVRSWNQLLTLDNGRFVGTIPSDHNPVYVDLLLPDRR